MGKSQRSLTKVKICGITNERDALLAAEHGAWAVGFIFYRQSPRFVTAAVARRIIARLPPFVTPVGVFVNERLQAVIKTAEGCGLKTLQFHGDETPFYCRSFRGFKVIKAFRMNGAFRRKVIERYRVSALLFDTFSSQCYGGCGKTFDWRLMNGLKGLDCPIILSGGLTPGNVNEAISRIHPYAVDVCSGVEMKPGKKSPHLLKDLFDSIP